MLQQQLMVALTRKMMRTSAILQVLELVEWYNKGDINFFEVTTVNLDE